MTSKVLLFSPIPVFTPTGMASGLGLRVWGLARALSARGHRVRIAEPAGGRGDLRKGLLKDCSGVVKSVQSPRRWKSELARLQESLHLNDKGEPV